MVSCPPAWVPSMSTGERFARAAYSAAVRPAGPDPRMMTDCMPPPIPPAATLVTAPRGACKAGIVAFRRASNQRARRLDKPGWTRYGRAARDERIGRISLMAILRKTPWLLIFFVVVGGLFGGLVAEILRAVAPTGPISRLFLENLTLGITTPITVDLYLL